MTGCTFDVWFKDKLQFILKHLWFHCLESKLSLQCACLFLAYQSIQLHTAIPRAMGNTKFYGFVKCPLYVATGIKRHLCSLRVCI